MVIFEIIVGITQIRCIIIDCMVSIIVFINNLLSLTFYQFLLFGMSLCYILVFQIINLVATLNLSLSSHF